MLLSTIEISENMSVLEAAERIKRAIGRTLVVHVKGSPRHSLDQWEQTLSLIGDLHRYGEDDEAETTIDSVWTDIRYDPGLAQSFRYSKTAQPLHSDGAYAASSPNLVSIVCAKQAVAGGATVFVDADAIAREAQTLAPDLYEKLISVPVSFSKFDGPGRFQPILGKEGGHTTINWNYYRVAAHGPEVEELRDGFFSFVDAAFFTKPEKLTALALSAGEAVIFHDRRVLHGRTAYEAHHRNDRLLWKCAFHWPKNE